MQVVAKLFATCFGRKLQKNVIQSSIHLMDEALCPQGTEVDSNVLQHPPVKDVVPLSPPVGQWLAAVLEPFPNCGKQVCPVNRFADISVHACRTTGCNLLWPLVGGHSHNWNSAGCA